MVDVENDSDGGSLESRQRSVTLQVRDMADQILKEAETSPQPADVLARRREAEDRLREEERAYRGEQRAAEINALKAQNDRVQHDMELRRKYASRAVGLAYVGVVFWCVMFLATGIARSVFDTSFLSDAALITLTTGATVNVIAVFLVVVRGLFPPEARPVSSGALPTQPVDAGR